MKWQPIETAPKDGREIIVFIPDVEMPAFVSERPEIYKVKYYPHVLAAYWSKDWYGDKSNPGWMPANLDEEYGSYVYPSHWMPLPEAPEA